MAQGQDDLLTQSLLLDEIGQSVIGMDSKWRVTYWNRASERLYGFAASEVLGKTPLDLGVVGHFQTAGPGPTGEEIAERVALGKDWSGEFWVRDRAGREFPVHGTISPIRGRHTVPVDIVAISKDITDRKYTEAMLRRLSAMVESSGDAIIGADMDGNITSWNAGAVRMLGWSAREAVGRRPDLFTTRAQEDADERVAERIRSGVFVPGLEARWRRKDGSFIDVELTVSPVYGQDGNLAGASGIARDITEIKRLRSEAAAERRRLLAAQEMAHVGSLEYSVATGATWHSEEFARIVGLGSKDSLSREWMLARTHPEDRDRVRQVWRSLYAGSGFADIEYRIVRPDGGQRWMHSRIRSVDDPEGKPLEFLDTVLDITDRKKAEQVLEWQARHDALTGLPNRYLITEVLQDFLDHGSRPAVMFVDIDRFKLVNDGIGHSGGDTILMLLGERLMKAVSAGDTVGRFGGDEFIIVCENKGMRAAQVLARRVRECIRAPFEVEERKIFLNVSVGIALAGPEDTAESMLGGADTAMYRAKSAGGDASVVYHSRMTRRATGRLDLESDLRLALDRGEMRLDYQPIINLVTETPLGFEALLRWDHPDHGMIPPDTFIPVAEETGLIVPVGAWVLQETLRQVQQWRDQVEGAANLSAAVNISGRQLVAQDFPDIVEAAILVSGIDPAAVHLEVTETVLMDEPDLPRETLQRLARLGVGLSIDDFGTGYSSLSYLKWLSARTLKVDRTFIQELGDDPHGGTVIELVVGMAKSLKLDVIAEGVETLSQLNELRRMGVTRAQGYLWSKPIPSERVPAWLNGRLRKPAQQPL
ncbi:EAL domain-containing protein [Arthrobacter sp. OV608]|uniref:sensor domain-containing protein n=1 Tax=Arthrobacter sp. OV608 TaxID=1882768 RepID=UPI0008B1BDB2|nr:EAL domain-containing protein [Arthrobacter sp. OV608]SEP85401.1 PAS domain S-box-containing protein/diguanylate cyclase (GGDEF) domain-containing protein [Arthrobacter sp. OV608]